MSIVISATDGGTLEALTRSMARQIGTVEREVDATVTRAALNLKREWRTEAQGHRHLPFLPAAVEVTDIPDGKRVSFGDGNQGQIAHIATFGSYRSGPVMNPFRHVPPEVLILRRYMAEIGARL